MQFRLPLNQIQQPCTYRTFESPIHSKSTRNLNKTPFLFTSTTETPFTLLESPQSTDVKARCEQYRSTLQETTEAPTACDVSVADEVYYLKTSFVTEFKTGRSRQKKQELGRTMTERQILHQKQLLTPRRSDPVMYRIDRLMKHNEGTISKL